MPRLALALLVALLCVADATAAEAIVPVEFRAAEESAAPSLEPMTVPDGTTIYVAPDALLTNTDIKSAMAQIDPQTGAPIVRLVFTDEGGRKLEDITAARVGRMIAILVEGKIVSAPRVMEPIAAGEAVISGNFTRDEAERLAAGIVPPSSPATQK